jgi:predicted esterase
VCGKPGSRTAREGRLLARPGAPAESGVTGLHTVEIAGRKPLLYVPSSSGSGGPAALIVSLHGAGGEARRGVDLFLDLADEFGFLIVAPAYQDQTWDLIAGSFRHDVEALDAALTWTFHRYLVRGIAVAGFSDGASYAVSLALTNGDLFSHALAFSPGFVAAKTFTGEPVLYVSHGTDDRVLPIERCSRALVPRLKTADYRVHYD